MLDYNKSITATIDTEIVTPATSESAQTKPLSPSIAPEVKQAELSLSLPTEAKEEDSEEPQTQIAPRDGALPLLRAAFNGDKERVIELCNKDTNVDRTDRFNEPTVRYYDPSLRVECSDTTALYYAVCRGHLEITKHLIEKGADIHKKDANGSTILQHAALHGQMEIMECLIQHGAQLSEQNKSGETALSWAARARRTAVVKYFIEHGADISKESRWSGDELLRLALRNQATKVAIYLVQQGAAMPDKSDLTRCLWRTVSGRDKPYVTFIKYLIENGADTTEKDEGGETILMCAARRKPVAVGLCDFFIKHGVNVSEKNIYGETVLTLATTGDTQNIAVIECLIKNGMKISEQNDDDGQTALMTAAYHGGLLETNLYLIQQGADVSRQKKDGMTALMCAAAKGYLRVAECLVENKANVHTKNHKGKSALMYAAEAKHFEIVRYLITKGADESEKDENGETILMHAARSKQFMMPFFKGANIFAQDNRGRTTLIYAVREGLQGDAIALAHRGVDIFQKDADQHTALWHAVERYIALSKSTEWSHFSIELLSIANWLISAYGAHPDEAKGLPISEQCGENFNALYQQREKRKQRTPLYNAAIFSILYDTLPQTLCFMIAEYAIFSHKEEGELEMQQWESAVHQTYENLLAPLKTYTPLSPLQKWPYNYMVVEKLLSEIKMQDPLSIRNVALTLLMRYSTNDHHLLTIILIILEQTDYLNSHSPVELGAIQEAKKMAETTTDPVFFVERTERPKTLF